MTRRAWLAWSLAVVLVFTCAFAARGLEPAAAAGGQPPANPDTWQIPPDASNEANPIAANEKILAQGRKIYSSKCQRCHGPGGKGDGPDADPDRKPGNLTDAGRAARNPDGVMFYKIWNGRKNPRMPAFKTDLAKDEVWTVIHYVKTLRTAS